MSLAGKRIYHSSCIMSFVLLWQQTQPAPQTVSEVFARMCAASLN